MKIRIANKNDNIKEIAELIYETDEYIYANMGDSKQQVINYLIEMINSNTIYNYKNCVLAIKNSHIVGLVVFTIHDDIVYHYDKWIDLNKKIRHVIENYILKCNDKKNYPFIELTCVSVKPEHRRQKVATKLINYLFYLFPTKCFQLSVLKQNKAAINLYSSLGFQISKEEKGYNSYYKHKPIIYKMVKK